MIFLRVSTYWCLSAVKKLLCSYFQARKSRNTIQTLRLCTARLHSLRCGSFPLFSHSLSNTPLSSLQERSNLPSFAWFALVNLAFFQQEKLKEKLLYIVVCHFRSRKALSLPSLSQFVLLYGNYQTLNWYITGFSFGGKGGAMMKAKIFHC